MSCKQLRKELRLDPKHPLKAPLMTAWTVPTKKELCAGKRAECLPLSHIIYRLKDDIHDLTHTREANENWNTEKYSRAKKKAAQIVRNWQVNSEVQHELWRGEALQIYGQAAKTTDPKRKKLEKGEAAKDKEAQHIGNMPWLVIRNLYPDPTTGEPLKMKTIRKLRKLIEARCLILKLHRFGLKAF